MERIANELLRAIGKYKLVGPNNSDVFKLIEENTSYEEYETKYRLVFRQDIRGLKCSCLDIYRRHDDPTSDKYACFISTGDNRNLYEEIVHALAYKKISDGADPSETRNYFNAFIGTTEGKTLPKRFSVPLHGENGIIESDFPVCLDTVKEMWGEDSLFYQKVALSDSLNGKLPDWDELKPLSGFSKIACLLTEYPFELFGGISFYDERKAVNVGLMIGKNPAEMSYFCDFEFILDNSEVCFVIVRDNGEIIYKPEKKPDNRSTSGRLVPRGLAKIFLQALRKNGVHKRAVDALEDMLDKRITYDEAKSIIRHYKRID